MLQRDDVGAEARWWGDWLRPAGRAVLVHLGAGRGFEINLQRCTTPGTTSDVVHYIADKPWASATDLDDLRAALGELTGFALDPVAPVWPPSDLQVSLYPGGRQG